MLPYHRSGFLAGIPRSRHNCILLHCFPPRQVTTASDLQAIHGMTCRRSAVSIQQSAFSQYNILAFHWHVLVPNADSTSCFAKLFQG